MLDWAAEPGLRAPVARNGARDAGRAGRWGGMGGEDRRKMPAVGGKLKDQIILKLGPVFCLFFYVFGA